MNRRCVRCCALGAVLALCAAVQARADAGWFESGDTQLRIDLQLLNDAEIIRYPLNQWPVPRAGVQYALANAKEHFATNSAVMAALERVRARAAAPAKARLTFDTRHSRRRARTVARLRYAGARKRRARRAGWPTTAGASRWAWT